MFRRSAIAGLVLFGAAPGQAAGLQPLTGEVRDAGSRQLLYRESYLGVRDGDVLQSLGIRYLDADGALLGRLSMDMSASAYQPEAQYSEPDGAGWEMRHVAEKWRLSLRTDAEGRERKQWPQPGPDVVFSPLLRRYLADHVDELVSGELNRVQVLLLPEGRIRRYDIQVQRLGQGAGEILRIALFSKRLFGAAQRSMSLEVRRATGRMIRYQGPALCLCAGDPEKPVDIEFRD